MRSEPQYRDLVIALPGYTIVEFDAAGQEFKLMAIHSGDATMLELCRPGEDPHSFLGSRMSPDWDYRELIAVNSDKDDPRYPAAYKVRKGGKVGNFSLQYRTSAKTYYTRARVDYGMNLTMAEAEHGHFIYHKTYTGMRPSWKRGDQPGLSSKATPRHSPGAESNSTATGPALTSGGWSRPL